jgi:uncharacterized paraquat-inducible protein A
MSTNKFIECQYCGVEFQVRFVDDDGTVEHCPACGESLDDYILDEDSFAEQDDDSWYESEE